MFYHFKPWSYVIFISWCNKLIKLLFICQVSSFKLGAHRKFSVSCLSSEQLHNRQIGKAIIKTGLFVFFISPLFILSFFFFLLLVGESWRGLLSADESKPDKWGEQQHEIRGNLSCSIWGNKTWKQRPLGKEKNTHTHSKYTCAYSLSDLSSMKWNDNVHLVHLGWCWPTRVLVHTYKGVRAQKRWKLMCKAYDWLWRNNSS